MSRVEENKKMLDSCNFNDTVSYEQGVLVMAGMINQSLMDISKSLAVIADKLPDPNLKHDKIPTGIFKYLSDGAHYGEGVYECSKCGTAAKLFKAHCKAYCWKCGSLNEIKKEGDTDGRIREDH